MESRPWHKFYNYEVPSTLRYPGSPIQFFVHFAATHYPDKTGIKFCGTELSFWEIRNLVMRLANALIKLGVKKGDRIGLAMPNCPQYVIAYYATLSAGGIVVNFNPSYTYDELHVLMKNTEIKYLFTFDTVIPTMKKLSNELDFNLIITKISDFIKNANVSSSQTLNLESEWIHFTELLDKSQDTSVPRLDFSPEDPALIFFTGGTTGVPKGALLTHGNIVASTTILSALNNHSLKFLSYDKRAIMGILPFFHIYSSTMCLNWSFFNLLTIIILPNVEMEGLMETIINLDSPVVFPAVPSLINAIISHPKSREMNLNSKIHAFRSGGSALPDNIAWKLQDLGVAFNQGWGMTETGGAGFVMPSLTYKKGSVGVPAIDLDVRIVDTENGTNNLKPGEPGEIIVKGPTVMKYYWNNPEETNNAIKDGWLYTGDIGYMDEDGFIYIIDRKKDMIISEGFNIYPSEIDEVIRNHEKVADAVTVGIPHVNRGEIIKAYIVIKPGETATKAEIINYCKEKLVSYKVPKAVEFRDSIPRSAVGKTLRKNLREEEIAKMAK